MSNKYIQVKDEKDLYRDALSNGIVNNDDKSYLLYKKKKQASKMAKQSQIDAENRINSIEKKIDSLEKNLSAILEILTNGKS